MSRAVPGWSSDFDEVDLAVGARYALSRVMAAAIPLELQV